MYEGPERRRRARFSAPGVDVHIRRCGWRRWLFRPERVAAVDFSVHGLGFETGQRFAPGERVRLAISVQSSEVLSMEGIVRHTTSIDGTDRHRIGVQLDVLGVRGADREKLQALLSRMNIDFGQV